MKFNKKLIPLLITEDWEIKNNIKPKAGKKFTADELHKMIDGYLEVINLTIKGDSYWMIVDEDGGNKKRFVNAPATQLARHFKAIASTDFIVGACVVIPQTMLD